MKQRLIIAFLMLGLSTMVASGCVMTVKPLPRYAAAPAAPPPAKAEVVQVRQGKVWVKGRWQWRNNRWRWKKGHFKTVRRGYSWNSGRWEQRGNQYVWVAGSWKHSGAATVVIHPTTAPPAPTYNGNPGSRAGHSWVRGSWRWKNGKWTWRAGRWQVRKAQHQWVPGHWTNRNGRYIWVKGHWKRGGAAVILHPTTAPPAPT